METDLKIICKLSERNERENHRFRMFLKSGSIPEDQIDSSINEIYDDVSSKIDCRECANCCMETLPAIDLDDIEKLSIGLGINKNEVKEKFLVDDEEIGYFTFNARPCPLLKDRSCSVYPYRPKECRSYPHLDKKEMAKRSMFLINNHSTCPIVYNVMEEFKERYHIH